MVNTSNLVVKLFFSGESNRKMGEVFSVLGRQNKNLADSGKALNYLTKAKQALLDLQVKNELGKNNEHKLEIIEKWLKPINS